MVDLTCTASRLSFDDNSKQKQYETTSFSGIQFEVEKIKLYFLTTWCVFFVYFLWFGDKLCATFDIAYKCFSPSLSRLPFWFFKTFNDFVHTFVIILCMRLVTLLVHLFCLHIMIFFLETWCSTKKKVGLHVGLKFDGKYLGLHLLCKTLG